MNATPLAFSDLGDADTAPDAVVGTASNGHLLLTGGNHYVLQLMSKNGVPPPASVPTFWENMVARQDYCTARGIAFSTWIFPDKLTLFAEDPVFIDHGIGSLYLRHYLPYAPNGVLPHYLGDVIQDQDDFHRTDSHLSVAGLRKTVLAIAREFDFPGQTEFSERVAATSVENPDFRGDLAEKLDLSAFHPTMVPGRVVPGRRGANGMTSGNDGMIEVLTAPRSRSNLKLLVFGDSFFHQSLIYLTFFFRNIIFMRSRFFHYEMIDAVAPDVIFCGMAERYLSQVADDATRPDFLSYPTLKSVAINPSHQFLELWGSLVNGALIRGADPQTGYLTLTGPQLADPQ